MKALLALPLLFFVLSAEARDCQVYGITDSPQKLDCSFKDYSVVLRCVKGTYFLNQSKVTNAFHMDVEEGSSPLVFTASNMQLTVVIEPKVDIQAELQLRDKVLLGTCH